MDKDSSITQFGGVVTAFAGTLTVGGYCFEQARALAHSRHFGIGFDVGDPRGAALVLPAVLVLAYTLGTPVAMALRRSTAMALVGVVVCGVITAALPPYGFRETTTSVVSSVAVWLILFTLTRALESPVRAGASALGRRAPGLRLPWAATWITATGLFVFGAWGYGYLEGRLQAERQSTFRVTSRDATRATVTFTTRGDIVERVLDISPGPDGRPRNVWLPGVAVRPMPPNGIRYETVVLGSTQPSEAVAP